MKAAHPGAAAPAAVLDTNAALDWLVFRDAGMAPLAAAIEAGAVCWRACPRMRDELARTLNFASLAPWLPDSEHVLSSFDRWARMLPAPVTLPALKCTDADDQVFIDLAIACGARWLITHDRALLKLARRGRERGLQIIRPADWRLPD